MAVPRTVSDGTPLTILRSISVAQMNPRPAAPPMVVVNMEMVTWPSRLNALENWALFHAWTLHTFGWLVVNVFANEKFERQAVPWRFIARPPS